MTFEEARMYVVNFPAYEEEFSEKTLEHVLPKFDVSLFQEKYTVREGHDAHLKSRGYQEVGRGKRRFEDEMTFKGRTWTSTVYENGVDYLVPNKYQNKESALLRECLLEAYPYLEGYNMNIYHLDGAKEIYITCKERNEGEEIDRTLYVPLEALRKNDAELIRSRMISYFSQYYAGEARKKYRDIALSALECEEAKQLFRILDERKMQSQKVSCNS